MPVSFSKLRIAGFKSFAEPTSVDILPGLTGIVGPNGCGKSNIVEALRWAMGESSARGLRGGEMEDVIFAGTAGRSSRNIAEVSITLNDTMGIAPPPFHDHPELEIQRKIERGHGSAYRVNGKEARARDVQTLFADLASGARASAMVSQGRVGALVAARPEERRAVLEEAAGITGLHARRHEAELKLRAAEANLSRAEDLKGQLDSQLGALKRQASQASRYRNISGAIREADAELMSILRARVERDRAAAHAAFRNAEAAVAEAAFAVQTAAAIANETAEILEPLRKAEADARTVLERLRVAQEQLAAEEGRARVALDEARRRLTTLTNDFRHAAQLRSDAVAAETRLASEDSTLAIADEAHPRVAASAEIEANAAVELAQMAEHDANRATEAAAEANALAQAAERALSQAGQWARRATEQLTRAGEERATLAARQIDPTLLDRASQEESTAQDALVAARTALDRAEQARSAAAVALAAARDVRAAAEARRGKLAAEATALAEILSVKDGERWPPMIDKLTAPPGLELALGAVLGEELTSALDPAADRYWREFSPMDPEPVLPDGARALSALTEGPPALRRALSQIGLVEDETIARASQERLTPGQVLVSREGAVWRWDGYTIRAGTPTAAAVRLRQRNRLRGLTEALAAVEQESTQTTAAQAQADQVARTTAGEEHAARLTRRDAETRLERARAALTALRNQAATVASRLAGIDEQLGRQEQDHAEAIAALDAARATHAASPDVAGLRAAVDTARRALAEARARETAARLCRESLLRDHAARSNRRRAIAAERGSWSERAGGATGRVAELAERLDAARLELFERETAPAAAAARRAAALEELQVAESAHRRAAKTLTEATLAAGNSGRAAHATETTLAARREAAVRAEGHAQQADHAWGTMAERILERLGSNPSLPDPPAKITAETEDKARRRWERLTKERDEMGPVNLRAETEAEAVEQQIATIDKDRDELTTAIARLRGSIGHLNREGRERLSEVFQQVDRHFQALFSRMFGGGRAHLAMAGSDDPLQAGLEIYAQPPGKKLTSLSLLSGGEQALTALSLIFAVFRCNPAPVCVLDEVDAPLDDANVERFCLLLEDIEKETKTRFLVVTHHPMTMARMDRLYGVTMQERGVSRLLSVDLARATAMVEQRQLPLETPARMAAE